MKISSFFFSNLAGKVMSHYAVAKGRAIGIYSTWDDCKAQVDRFPGAIFKKFKSRNEAENFIKTRSGAENIPNRQSSMSVLEPVRGSQANTNSGPLYETLEKDLLKWAQSESVLTQFNLSNKAAEIAKMLGIGHFKNSTGWLKYHIESNPNVYKSLRNTNRTGIKSSDLLSAQRPASSDTLYPKRLLPIYTKEENKDAKRIKFEVQDIKIPAESSKRLLSTYTKEENEDTKPAKRIKLEVPDIKNPIEITKENRDAWVYFKLDDDGYVMVYTDGACSRNGTTKARAGIGVWFADNHPLNVSRSICGRMTNNAAEIEAVTTAARQALKVGVRKLTINTDSQFIINCVTQWIPKWKSNGWRTIIGKEVINKIELIEMEKSLDHLTIKWNHVPGHSGNHGNEMADRLARAGINK